MRRSGGSCRSSGSWCSLSMNNDVQRTYHTDTPMTSPRPYTKTRRAELEPLTRERITEAAVELHGSLGPARTHISAIAPRAAIRDPAARLAVALSELYAWYARTQRMLELLIRDLPLVPAVQTQFRLPS